MPRRLKSQRYLNAPLSLLHLLRNALRKSKWNRLYRDKSRRSTKRASRRAWWRLGRWLELPNWWVTMKWSSSHRPLSLTLRSTPRWASSQGGSKNKRQWNSHQSNFYVAIPATRIKQMKIGLSISLETEPSSFVYRRRNVKSVCVHFRQHSIALLCQMRRTWQSSKIS